MKYEGTVYRPPSEANSLIIQATIGCTHNSCTFCPMYKDKKFRMRPLEDVLADMRACRAQYAFVGRIFFADGDCFCLQTEKLLRLLEAVREIFPECGRVSVYGRAAQVLKKSDGELASLKRAGLGIVYIGAESGSAEVLRRVNKGETPEQVIEAAQRLESAGIAVSATFLSGLGGRELMEEHAVKTGEMIGKMGASYVGLLTLMPAPDTPVFEDYLQGKFELLSPNEVFEELKIILSHARCEKACILRSNHASNRLVLRGTLPHDRGAMLRQVERAIASSRP